MKLWARTLFRRRQKMTSEGIPAWELSYRVEIAKLRQFRHERNRRRNYDLHGLRKLGADRQTIAK